MLSRLESKGHDHSKNQKPMPKGTKTMPPKNNLSRGCLSYWCDADKDADICKTYGGVDINTLDEAIYLGTMLSEIYFKAEKNNIAIVCFTDNKSLFDCIHSTKFVSEKLPLFKRFLVMVVLR